MRLVALEYRLQAELAANAGRVLTYEHLSRPSAEGATTMCAPCAPS